MADTLRLAGLEDEWFKSEREFDDELTAIRKLVMGHGQNFLPDAFHGLRELVGDGRLVIVEGFERGEQVIHGCIGYEIQSLLCTDQVTGERMMQRVVMLRLLVVRDVPHRAEIARRLALEAQLRGTIRARHDDEDRPHALGTLGVMMENNERGLRWAANLGHRTNIVAPNAPLVDAEPALKALREYAEAMQRRLKLQHGIRFVIASRTNLVEAADLNFAGRDVLTVDGGDGFQLRYDPSDYYRQCIDTAIANLVERNPSTLARLGLLGDHTATAWGPPEVAQMRIGRIGDGDEWEDFSR